MAKWLGNYILHAKLFIQLINPKCYDKTQGQIDMRRPIRSMAPEGRVQPSSYSFFCFILTSDQAKHAIPKSAEVHIPLAWASLADNMGLG